MNYRLFCLLVLSTLFFSCEKTEDEKPRTLEIETNSPVIVGWNLQMTTMSTGQYRTFWYGPNGWKITPQTISNQDYFVERNDITLQDAGEYKVQWKDEYGKVTGEGKVNVEVVQPPNAPCTITPNTSTSSVGGVGTYNFTYKTFGPASGFYVVQGSPGSSDFMQFGFWGQSAPKPGKYKIDGGYFGTKYGTTGVYIQAGALYHFMALEGDVYVTTNSNGKLSVSFCNVTFSNPINPSNPLVISANMTQP